MLLIRTSCYTDWKGRPSHSIVKIAASDDRQALIEAMNKDVRSWMCLDLAMKEVGEMEDAGNPPEDDGWEEIRAATLDADKSISDDHVKASWLHQDRFEMQLDGDHREFVERCDGDVSTIVYHLLNDDFTPG